MELWDWKAGKKLTELDGFPSQVNALTFSPDGKLLATGDKFGTIRVWDPVTFKETAIFKGHASGISALIFSPDSQWLYSGAADGIVRRWKIVPEPDPDTIEGDVAFYPVKVGSCCRRQERVSRIATEDGDASAQGCEALGPGQPPRTRAISGDEFPRRHDDDNLS